VARRLVQRLPARLLLALVPALAVCNSGVIQPDARRACGLEEAVGDETFDDGEGVKGGLLCGPCRNPWPYAMVSPVLAGPSLAMSLDAFYVEHRPCGELEGGVEEKPEAGLWLAWMECRECGARFEREEGA
jgi:hypothetical protein